MKTFILYFLLFSSTTGSLGQSWQWGRSGGSSTAEGADSGTNLITEKINTMVSDTNGNIYTCSQVWGNDLIIDGVSYPTNNIYDFGYTAEDGLLTSYDCNGNLRWYKAIGSWVSFEKIRQIGIDAQNNIYVLLQLSIRGVTNPPQPVHLGLNDVLPESAAVNLNKERVFLIKYNSDGVLQWYKSPQPANIPAENATWSNGAMVGLDMQVDPQGNCYILSRLGYGPYCGGAYVTPTTTFPQNHILKYDSSGIFVSGNLIAYNYQEGSRNAIFKRNHNNGKLYIVGGVSGSIFSPQPEVDGIYLNGLYRTYLDFTKYVAEFNADGTFSWLRHNNPKAPNPLWRDLAFDNENNIYYTAGFFGTYSDIEGEPATIDSWNGQPFEQTPMETGDTLCGFGAIIKIDPNGDEVWRTNSITTENFSSGIFFRTSEDRIQIVGDEVVLPYGSNNMKWQSITNINPAGSSVRACIKRFNKNTGQIIGADFLDGIPNTQSVFGASCIDSKGNIYGGGFITSSVVVNGVTLNSNGGPNDFFIAKFGSANCDFLATTQQNFEETEVFPNPVSSVLNINNYEVVTYELYTNLGAKVKEGSLDANGKINMEALAKGIYLLQTKNAYGNIKTDKIIKE